MNCIIIHGCPTNIEKAQNPQTRTYDKHWIPWTKEQLIAKGIPTITPLMPNPWEPDYEEFKEAFNTLTITEDTVLVGHSCGCAFLVRWLGETKRRISKLVLVAPWKIASGTESARKNFYEYPIDPSIKERIKEITYFTADDEEADGKKSLDIFYQMLGGRIITLNGRGHYTIDDMGTNEFPELLDVIVKKELGA